MPFFVPASLRPWWVSQVHRTSASQSSVYRMAHEVSLSCWTEGTKQWIKKAHASDCFLECAETQKDEVSDLWYISHIANNIFI